jgi:hypothetical protein
MLDKDIPHNNTSGSTNCNYTKIVDKQTLTKNNNYLLHILAPYNNTRNNIQKDLLDLRPFLIQI